MCVLRQNCDCGPFWPTTIAYDKFCLSAVPPVERANTLVEACPVSSNGSSGFPAVDAAPVVSLIAEAIVPSMMPALICAEVKGVLALQRRRYVEFSSSLHPPFRIVVTSRCRHFHPLVSR